MDSLSALFADCAALHRKWMLKAKLSSSEAVSHNRLVGLLQRVPLSPAAEAAQLDAFYKVLSIRKKAHVR